MQLHLLLISFLKDKLHHRFCHELPEKPTSRHVPNLHRYFLEKPRASPLIIRNVRFAAIIIMPIKLQIPTPSKSTSICQPDTLVLRGFFRWSYGWTDLE
jgi:hypothetical protein